MRIECYVKSKGGFGVFITDTNSVLRANYGEFIYLDTFRIKEDSDNAMVNSN